MTIKRGMGGILDWAHQFVKVTIKGRLPNEETIRYEEIDLSVYLSIWDDGIPSKDDVYEALENYRLNKWGATAVRVELTDRVPVEFLESLIQFKHMEIKDRERLIARYTKMIEEAGGGIDG